MLIMGVDAKVKLLGGVGLLGAGIGKTNRGMTMGCDCDEKGYTRNEWGITVMKSGRDATPIAGDAEMIPLFRV